MSVIKRQKFFQAMNSRLLVPKRHQHFNDTGEGMGLPLCATCGRRVQACSMTDYREGAMEVEILARCHGAEWSGRVSFPDGLRGLPEDERIRLALSAVNVFQPEEV